MTGIPVASGTTQTPEQLAAIEAKKKAEEAMLEQQMKLAMEMSLADDESNKQ